jgi:hypothetical protein
MLFIITITTFNIIFFITIETYFQLLVHKVIICNAKHNGHSAL